MSRRHHGRASRGSLYTVDYKVTLPDGRWRWEVLVVRAMSPAEAEGKLRAHVARKPRTSQLLHARISDVRIAAGNTLGSEPPWVLT